MATHSLRIRLLFEDRSVLSQTQRSEGMDHSWILIEPNQHPKISDVCNHLLQTFNLRNSCPNGIVLFMTGFVLPPSESIRLLKDKDIICVKKKGIEVPNAHNLLDVGEANKREPVDNGMLLLANEEFVKETGGYESESDDAEVEKMEEDLSLKETASKKRKASTKLRSSKKKKTRSVVMDDVKVATEDNNINNDECLPTKIISKKNKSNKEKKSGEDETIIEKVTSSSKVKRKKKHGLREDETVTDKIDNVNNGEGVKQESTAPDGAKKVPSRSARRKKAKRLWRREHAKISQNPGTHLEPEVSKSENKQANGHPDIPLKQDQAVKNEHENMTEQEERNNNGNMETVLVPCVVRPGHIRFEPLDEDEDVKQIEVPLVAFEWNGITSKKKGQKWGLEKFSISRKDDFQNSSKEPSAVLSADTHVPLIDAHVPLFDLNDFDKLPLCTSPKEGDVIAYRLLELSSSWTPELSSFRVGKISYYDTDNIVLKPVPEYPIVLDKMDEDGPDNSLYQEDGSLEIKFAGLVDVRSVKQSNSDDMKAISNGISQTFATNLMSSSSGNMANISKDPSPVVTNKDGKSWEELTEALNAKKSELLAMNEEMKKDSGKNKWSYRALRGSALGPTMALLRSKNNI